MIERTVRMTAKHKPTGRCRHYAGNELLGPAAALAIARYPGDTGVLLLYFDAEGAEMTDTWHLTIDAAMHMANWEYGVEPGDWSEPDPGAVQPEF